MTPETIDDLHRGPTPGVAGSLALELVGDHDSVTRLARRIDRVAALARERLAGTFGPAEEAAGHPVHPALTDLPIGFWTSATVLDLIGGRRGRVAARRLVALGVLTAVPTALSGLHDAGDRTKGLDRRIVALHGAFNGGATLAYALSWRARRREHWFRGIGMGLVGAALATAGGALGGELAFAATGPSHHAGAGDEAGHLASSERAVDGSLDGAGASGPAPGPVDVGGGDPPDPMGGVDPATVDQGGR